MQKSDIVGSVCIAVTSELQVDLALCRKSEGHYGESFVIADLEQPGGFRRSGVILKQCNSRARGNLAWRTLILNCE